MNQPDPRLIKRAVSLAVEYASDSNHESAVPLQEMLPKKIIENSASKYEYTKAANEYESNRIAVSQRVRKGPRGAEKEKEAKSHIIR